ncbi:unnamed protein product, partial [Coregonus sp. 'balchen']
FTNIGQAYNPTTGIFTPPVRGVYNFIFRACNNQRDKSVIVAMIVNGKFILHNCEHEPDSHVRCISNAVSQQLEKGDVVYMEFPSGNMLFDSDNNHNIFSGFLLFPIGGLSLKPASYLKRHRFGMKGVVALLALLFCLSGAWAQGGSGGLRENDITQQGHSTGREGIVREVQIERRGTEAMGMMDDRTPTEVDLLTDVKELRDMVVITNIGQTYNPTTGIFTAPVRGVYNFRFRACSNQDVGRTDIVLYKNGQRMMHNFEYRADLNLRCISNGVSLQLEKGDEVYMRLPSEYELFDSDYYHNIFSGFLLFP